LGVTSAPKKAGEVVLGAIKGASSSGKARLSAYVLQKAILTCYTRMKLFPTGIFADIPSVEDWALKHGVALKRMVPCSIHLIL